MYKKNIFIISIIMISIFNPSLVFAKELKILFIGNSYTYANDLPGVLEKMLDADKRFQVEMDMVALPGWKLSKHAYSEDTHRKILSKHWDYVILQEQSVLPVFSTERRKKMIPAVQKLQKSIKKVGARPLLFMTWGRRDGFKKLGYRTFNEMQDELNHAYTEVGRRLGISVIPVGEAWREARKQKPFFPLWQSDGSHPSKSGVYLSACVFYYKITGRRPRFNKYRPKLTASTISFLRNVAEIAR